MVLNATVVTHFIVRIVLKMWRQAQLSLVIAAIIHFALIAASKPAQLAEDVLGIVKNVLAYTSPFLLGNIRSRVSKTQSYAERVAGMMNLRRRTSNCVRRLKNFERRCRLGLEFWHESAIHDGKA